MIRIDRSIETIICLQIDRRDRKRVLQGFEQLLDERRCTLEYHSGSAVLQITVTGDQSIIRATSDRVLLHLSQRDLLEAADSIRRHLAACTHLPMDHSFAASRVVIDGAGIHDVVLETIAPEFFDKSVDGGDVQCALEDLIEDGRSTEAIDQLCRVGYSLSEAKQIVDSVSETLGD